MELILFFVCLAIVIALLRWVLRVNVIVEQLDEIAMSNQKIVQNLEMITASLCEKKDLSIRSGNSDESIDRENIPNQSSEMFRQR